ncbi:MAG: hypothetical protein AB7Q17_01360 [Phycisphaerae bacterium]
MTATEILNDLERDIDRAGTQWAIFAETALQAYDTAYNRQQQLLNAIKQKIAAREQTENDRMAFALTILTVGILGPIADNVVGWFKPPPATTRLKPAIDQLGEKSGEAIAGGLVDLAAAPSAPDAFGPVGRSPTYVGSKLRETFLRWTSAMSGLAAGLKASGSSISADVANRVRSALKNSPFFTDIPRGATEGVLVPGAELALWIGWLHDRDARWWSSNSTPSNVQTLDFDPLRKRLVELGVPAQTIAAQTPLFDESSGAGRGFTTPGLHMSNAIAWAKSVDAVLAMLRHVPKHAKGVASALSLFKSKPS